MVWANRVTALLLLALVAVAWKHASEFPDSAGVFPKVAAAALALLSIILLLRSFSPAIAVRRDGEGSWGLSPMVIPLGALALLSAGIYAMQFVGFFPVALVFGGGLFVLLSVHRYVLYWAMFIGTLILIHAGFAWLLNVPLWSPKAFGV